MEIYRVPGSVSFLHSGALLHAILPRSQCWCVDGVSKFAFRVLPETYYRIELPGETAEDLELVEALKVTLKKVLFYERTPCPFARGFTVDLPAEEIKVKKRNSVREGPAKKWRMEKTYSWKPEGWEEEELTRQLEGKSSRSGGDKRSEPSDEDDAASDRSEEEEEERLDASRATPSRLRPTALGSMRSVTAPSQVRTQQTITSRVRSRVQAVENVDRAEKAEKVRFSAEVQRRSSVRVTRLSTIPVDMPPSPPDSSAGAELQVEDSTNDLSEDLEDVLNEVDEEVASSENEAVETTKTAESEPISDIDGGSEADSVKIGIVSSEPPASDEAAILQSNEAQTPSVPLQLDAEQYGDSEAEDTQPNQEAASQPSFEPFMPEMQHTETTHNENVQVTETTSASAIPPPAREIETTEDPYAAIQARIQLRRSIGGSTTTFHPTSNPPISKSSSSNASSVSIASQRSNKPKPNNRAQRNHSITAALVNKACAVFLGPPAHLVTMMLRIAARFSSGAFGSNSIFFVESPIGSPRRIPGSFYLEDEEEEEEDWDEDDFGVPLKSPIRVSALRERARRHGWEME
jgi:hypothetical protein